MASEPGCSSQGKWPVSSSISTASGHSAAVARVTSGSIGLGSTDEVHGRHPQLGQGVFEDAGGQQPVGILHQGAVGDGVERQGWEVGALAGSAK